MSDHTNHTPAAAGVWFYVRCPPSGHPPNKPWTLEMIQSQRVAPGTTHLLWWVMNLNQHHMSPAKTPTTNENTTNNINGHQPNEDPPDETCQMKNPHQPHTRCSSGAKRAVKAALFAPVLTCYCLSLCQQNEELRMRMNGQTETTKPMNNDPPNPMPNKTHTDNENHHPMKT
ncbi:hypothetical protein BS47DRAFT_1362446 [Hydnum rufescens UP504]|uniref:Uncharacterized protein n=1 Tax=Hydnum rufescens UP504 TaxID=1448309 RepID=A0A9P6AWU1_9AGAM|nr:hypothetical protein BS47DRAFT_1362446 [Hydnum rufescens UP504]